LSFGQAFDERGPAVADLELLAGLRGSLLPGVAAPGILLQISFKLPFSKVHAAENLFAALRTLDSHFFTPNLG
jgi:hypothetical protein